MKKSIITSILICQMFTCGTLFSQIEKKDCNDISILTELSIEEKAEIIKSAKGFVEYNNSKIHEIKIVYCPQTELYFSGNCTFPYDYHIAKQYLGILLYDLKSKLILKSHSDNLNYKRNPKQNLIRAENVKNIFIFYGIKPERIEIIDLKDQYPIDNNKTKMGRENNKYVRMEVTN